MKVFMSVDMEGISGICHPDEVMPGRPGYEYGRKMMAADVNAAIDGALEAGATEIVVADSHDGMRNLPLHELALDKPVRLISGVMRQNEMVEGLDSSFDAALFIGYHARAGDPIGILSHTYAPKQFHKVEVNGAEVGEAQINAGVAGCFGVPVAMLSGDQALKAEASRFLGDVPVAVVKRAIDRMSAEFLNQSESLRRIREAASEGLRNLGQRSPYRFETPATMRIAMVNATQANLVATIPGTKRGDGTDVFFEHADFREIYRFMVAAMLIAMFCTDADF
jgi:D-amino peptidase